jgi:hypothetical protein
LSVSHPEIKVDVINYKQKTEKKVFYDKVIYVLNHFIIDRSLGLINECFTGNLEVLNTMMIGVETDHFIYLDYSHHSQYVNNNVYRTIKNMAIDLVKMYSNEMNQYYTILHLYDLIGYKFPEFPNQGSSFKYFNQLLEENDRLIIEDSYQNIHFTYILDVAEAVRKCLFDKSVVNTEQHLRYDNKGTSIINLVDLFEKENHHVYLYRKINTNKKIAPFKGEPSYLISREFPVNLWVRKRMIYSSEPLKIIKEV